MRGTSPGAHDSDPRTEAYHGCSKPLAPRIPMEDLLYNRLFGGSLKPRCFRQESVCHPPLNPEDLQRYFQLHIVAVDVRQNSKAHRFSPFIFIGKIRSYFCVYYLNTRCDIQGICQTSGAHLKVLIGSAFGQ